MVPLACCALVGTWVGIGQIGKGFIWGSGLVVAGAALALLAIVVRVPRLWIVVHGAILVASVGVGICQVAVAHPSALVTVSGQASRLIIDGTVTSRPHPSLTPWGETQCSANVSVARFVGEGQTAQYPHTKVAIVSLPCGVIPGQNVRIEGRPIETEPRQEVAFRMVPHETQVSGTGRASERIVAKIDDGMGQVLDGAPQHAQGLIPGVALGDDSRVSSVLADAMKLTGLTHLIAVSGGHISIVIAITLAIVGRRHSAIAASLCAVALVGLVLLVGPHPSVIRAVGMSVVLLAAMSVGRGTGAVPALCIAIITTSWAFPYIAMGYGFWLSAAATAGIVTVGSPLAEMLAVWMPRGLAEAIAIPLAAQLACVPILMLFSEEGSVWAVAANALVAPVVAPLTIAGLIVALAAPLPLASLALIPATMATWWIDVVARSFAAAPGSGIPLLWSGVVCFAMLAALVAFRGAMLAALVAVALGCWWAWTFVVGRPAGAPEDWAAIQCDVGQGSALIARNEAGATIMMDVGPEGPSAARCLSSAGIRELDLLILSHAHSDHIGGLPEVMSEVDIAEVWLSPNPDPADNTEWVERQLDASGIPYRSVRAGETFQNFLEILWPITPNQREGEANAQSLAAYIDVSGGLLVLSDMTADSQERLAPHIGHVPIVIMAHHGSADQSSQLAANASPDFTFISVGENSYGHPAPAALDLYSDSQVFDTLTCGPIAITAEGNIESRCDETP